MDKDIKKEVICFIGLATTGKDYNASIYIDKANSDWNFKKISLADPLRNMLWNVIGFTPSKNQHDISYSEFKQNNIFIKNNNKLFGFIPWNINIKFTTGRGLLQNLGTVMRQTCGEDFWADLWYKDVLKSNKNIVCCDMRYPNEIKKALLLTRKNCKVTFIWTQFSGADYDKLLKDKHSSEALAQFMYRNRGKYDLYDCCTISHRKIKQICEDFKNTLI